MKNNKKAKVIGDTLLIAGLLLMAGVIFLISSFSENGAEGETVYIRRNGELIKCVPLDQDIRFDLEGLLTVIVEKGQVRVENAVCSDKLCEHMGRISKSGESIVCLPSGITVEIVGGEFDFII